MKTFIYETSIETEAELLARITAAAYQVQNIPVVFERVRQSMFRRCLDFVLKQIEEFLNIYYKLS